MLDGSILELVFLAIIFVISISLHEYAHAWTSVKLGDPTPELQGRNTPNPLVHIDPLGFLMIFLVRFGWWRPVIVNPAYYKHPVRDELLVALAGPATNVLLAIGGTIILMIYVLMVGPQALMAGNDIIVQFWYMFGWLNIILAVFNMLPFPPLDGWRLVKFFLPNVARAVLPYQNWLMFGFLALLFLPGTGPVVRGFLTWLTGIIYGGIYTSLALVFL